MLFIVEFFGGPYNGETKTVWNPGARIPVVTMTRHGVKTIYYRYTSKIELDEVTILIAQYP